MNHLPAAWRLSFLLVKKSLTFDVVLRSAHIQDKTHIFGQIKIMDLTIDSLQ